MLKCSDRERMQQVELGKTESKETVDSITLLRGLSLYPKAIDKLNDFYQFVNVLAAIAQAISAVIRKRRIPTCAV
jgi:hypothetical protein